jgi:hypothetical protein
VIGDRKNRSWLSAVRVPAAVVIAGAVLTACSPQPGAPSAPQPAAPEAGSAAAGTTSAAGAEAPAQAGAPAAPASPVELAADAVNQALIQLAAAAPEPTREQMQQAYAQAGMPAEATEVSIYKTPTGLDVDAIEAAVPVDGQCVVGQVREGTVTVVVLPALASGRCFVGEQY